MADGIEAREHTAGQTVYNRDGRKLYYRRDLGDGTAIVSRWLKTEGWDGEAEEYVSDEPIIVNGSQLFKAPPTEALSTEVADLNGKIAAAKQELSFVQHQATAAENERDRLMDALTAVEPLRNIERFIAGEITHFVVVGESYGGEQNGDVGIETFEQAITQFSDRGRANGMKLMSLFGDSKGKLDFRINHYSEGSGSWQRVIPCISENEAKATSAQLLESLWQTFDPSRNTYAIAQGVNAAEALGLPVPANVRTHFDAKTAEALSSNVEKAREALAAAEAKLAALTKTEA